MTPINLSERLPSRIQLTGLTAMCRELMAHLKIVQKGMSWQSTSFERKIGRKLVILPNFTNVYS